VRAAVRGLQEQDCSFRIQLIEAKGREGARDWLSRCQTEFFAVIPSNVLLEPNAIPKLFEGIRTGHPKAVAFVGFVTDDGGGIEPHRIAIIRRAAVERATSIGDIEEEVGLVDSPRWQSAADATAPENGQQTIPGSVIGRRTSPARGGEPRLQ
jgi:hypothetical protein